MPWQWTDTNDPLDKCTYCLICHGFCTSRTEQGCGRKGVRRCSNTLHVVCEIHKEYAAQVVLDDMIEDNKR